MSLTTELYLFRHGETDWNREHRFQGHTDIPLNESGREQAARLAMDLGLHSLDALLTSDLSRARETAALIHAQLKLPIIIAPELRECNLGNLEGKLRDEIKEIQGETSWSRWLSVKPEDLDFGFTGGETKKEHLIRLLHFLESFCISNPHLRKIGISTHGGCIRRLVHHCNDAPTEAIALPNCALYLITFNATSGAWKFEHSLSESGDSNVWGN